MTNENGAQTDAQQGEEAQSQQGTQPQTDAQQGEEAGGPDDAKAADKYRAQRDEARAEGEGLKKSVESLKAEKAELESKVSELEKANAKLKADMKQAAQDYESEKGKTKELREAGCLDSAIDIAVGLLDDDMDVETLKKERPFLFKSPSGSTGFKPGGATSGVVKSIHEAMQDYKE